MDVDHNYPSGKPNGCTIILYTLGIYATINMKSSNMALKIVVDSREPDLIVALLMELGIDIEKRTITPGDYIVSSECGIERKTVKDFINSVFSGRVFEQVNRLREAYEKPILILEGEIEEELVLMNNPRSFWGDRKSVV